MKSLPCFWKTQIENIQNEIATLSKFFPHLKSLTPIQFKIYGQRMMNGTTDGSKLTLTVDDVVNLWVLRYQLAHVPLNSKKFSLIEEFAKTPHRLGPFFRESLPDSWIYLNGKYEDFRFKPKPRYSLDLEKLTYAYSFEETIEMYRQSDPELADAFSKRTEGIEERFDKFQTILSPYAFSKVLNSFLIELGERTKGKVSVKIWFNFVVKNFNNPKLWKLMGSEKTNRDGVKGKRYELSITAVMEHFKLSIASEDHREIFDELRQGYNLTDEVLNSIPIDNFF